MIAIKMEILLEEKVPKKMSLPPTRRNADLHIRQKKKLRGYDKSATLSQVGMILM